VFGPLILASILFLWLAMLGAAVAFRRSEHMRMTAVVASTKASTRAYLDVAHGLGLGKADALRYLEAASED